MTTQIKPADWKDVLHSELHAPWLNAGEVIELCEKYGPTDFYRAKLQVGRQYFNGLQQIYFEKRDRRGEVVLIIRNRQNRLLLHTKPFYPPNTFRLPTGGIRPNESVLQALHRELAEETSFSPLFIHFSGLVLSSIVCARRKMGLCSYLFEVVTEGTQPRPLDSSENISGYEWVPRPYLAKVIEQLESFTVERWRNWGEYRAVAHRIAAGLSHPSRKRSGAERRLKNDPK